MISFRLLATVLLLLITASSYAVEPVVAPKPADIPVGIVEPITELPEMPVDRWRFTRDLNLVRYGVLLSQEELIFLTETPTQRALRQIRQQQRQTAAELHGRGAARRLFGRNF